MVTSALGKFPSPAEGHSAHLFVLGSLACGAFHQFSPTWARDELPKGKTQAVKNLEESVLLVAGRTSKAKKRGSLNVYVNM